MGHDELDILILEPRGIDLLAVILFFFFLLLGLNGLSLLTGLGMAVASVVTSLSVLGGELGSSSLLSGGINVLNLSLTEDTVYWLGIAPHVSRERPTHM